jgi:hypothetical protein
MITLLGGDLGVTGGFSVLEEDGKLITSFETNFPLKAPCACACKHDERPTVGVYGEHFRNRRRAKGTNHRSGSNVPRAIGFAAMGIPLGSMTNAEISDAIPPAFSKFIAEQWLQSRPGAARRRE